MKNIKYIAITLGFITLIVGIISRITMRPLAVAPGGGLSAQVLLSFTNTCFLIAVAFILLEGLTAKK
jgi:hypothetical protein